MVMIDLHPLAAPVDDGLIDLRLIDLQPVEPVDDGLSSSQLQQKLHSTTHHALLPQILVMEMSEKCISCVGVTADKDVRATLPGPKIGLDVIAVYSSITHIAE